MIFNVQNNAILIFKTFPTVAGRTPSPPPPLPSSRSLRSLASPPPSSVENSCLRPCFKQYIPRQFTIPREPPSKLDDLIFFLRFDFHWCAKSASELEIQFSALLSMQYNFDSLSPRSLQLCGGILDSDSMFSLI